MSQNLPSPQSYEQLLSDGLSSYGSALGINDYNPNSVVVSFFSVVALMTARAAGDLFQILRDYSVDRATGDALKRLAQEYNVTPGTAKPSTGNVNIIDDSFTKIFTYVYAGTNAPNVGSTTINVGDASHFPSTGSVYIGRGTPDVEGPLPYTSPTQVGSYWTITLTPSPTAKFHNIGETVILAQGGNRTIPINTTVISFGTGSNPNILYNTIATAVILDGETEVDNVGVLAQLPGSQGNVPAGGITQFSSAPVGLSNSTVTNPLPFTTGADSDTDDQLRVRIKTALASTGLGTASIVKSSLIGATPSDQNATIVSDSLVLNNNSTVTVYVDDGTGYEETSNGVGLEAIVDSALGGEYLFQLQTGGRQAPVAKPFLQSLNSAPFDLIGGDTLAVVVGNTTYQHIFQNSDFVSPGNATAFEVTASINANPLIGFEALTSDNATYVDIRPKTELSNTIHTTIPTTDPSQPAAPASGAAPETR